MQHILSHDPQSKPAVALNEDGLRDAMHDENVADIGQLALRTGLNRSTLHRVMSKSTVPGEEFIAALLAAFPNHKFDQLFTVTK